MTCIADTRLIGHLHVFDVASIKITYHDVTLRSRVLHGHLADLGNVGIAIVCQHHINGKVAQPGGTRQRSYRQQHQKQQLISIS